MERVKSRPDSLEADFGKLDLGSQPASTTEQVGAPGPTSRLGLDIGRPVSPVQTWKAGLSSILTIYIVGIAKAQAYPDIIYSQPALPRHVVFALPSPKIDSWAYKNALTKLVATIRPLIYQSTNILLKAGTTDHLDLIMRFEEKDNSHLPQFMAIPAPVDVVGSRKMVIPIALLLLCAFSLDDEIQVEEMTKGSISNVLLSLVALWPDSNPPRAALKRVNEVLLGRDR